MKNKKANLNFKTIVKKFEPYHKDPEQYHKIFTELDFAYVSDGCDGFCPECDKKMKCEVYKRRMGAALFVGLKWAKINFISILFPFLFVMVEEC